MHYQEDDEAKAMGLVQLLAMVVLVGLIALAVLCCAGVTFGMLSNYKTAQQDNVLRGGD